MGSVNANCYIHPRGGAGVRFREKGHRDTGNIPPVAGLASQADEFQIVNICCLLSREWRAWIGDGINRAGSRFSRTRFGNAVRFIAAVGVYGNSIILK